MALDGQPRFALRPDAAAEAIGVGRTELFALIRRGELPSFKVGRSRLIAVVDLEAWVERQRADAVVPAPVRMFSGRRAR